MKDLGHFFDLKAHIYKRRGSFGSLCYYDAEEEVDVDTSLPRGRLDLSKEETYVKINGEPTESTPTKLLLTINVKVLGGIEKTWQSCFGSEIEQYRWYKAINAFDGKPVESIRRLTSSPWTLPTKPGLPKLHPSTRFEKLSENTVKTKKITKFNTEHVCALTGEISRTQWEKNNFWHAEAFYSAICISIGTSF